MGENGFSIERRKGFFVAVLLIYLPFLTDCSVGLLDSRGKARQTTLHGAQRRKRLDARPQESE
ncbi:hypothetical protein B1B04_07455 [Lysinibacillus sp. KCTC 33748]|nr:hypothetical protein B1B04_07455 [Lysinibacillus sp. KCTC 33748]